MIYGLIQYYHDELAAWNRVAEFHKQESGQLVRQVTVTIDQQVNSPANEKESSGFIDQLMVLQQEFDHVMNLVASQLQRLEKTASTPDKLLENPISSQQSSLRAQMQRVERNFIRTKYACAIFLSSFLTDQVPVSLKLKAQHLALRA